MYMEAPRHGRRIELAAFAHFGSLEAIEAAIVRAIVRGEQPVGTLKETTIRISARGVERTIGSPADVFLSVTAGDLAEGLLNLKHDPAALAEWASFILLTTEMLQFNDRHTEYCDRLVGAVWDLAFGIAIQEPTLNLARSIRTRFAKE